MRAAKPPRLRLALALGLSAVASGARAQLAVGVSADSDYRFRGISLSAGKPDLSLNLAYDHASGAYGGASLIGVAGAPGGTRLLGYVAYAGYSARLNSRVAWDAGVSDAHLSVPQYVYSAARRYRVDYADIYLGLASDHFSGRLYYSPNYLGERTRALYADLNAAIRPAERWRLFAHAGALTPISGADWPGAFRERYDLRAGAALRIDRLELQLAWSRAQPPADYPPREAQSRDALVLGANYSF